jgi:DNA-binding NarL/FixJ family response regulator
VLIEEIKKLGPNIPILLLTGAVFDRNVVRDTIEKKVARYLDKTASLNTIVTEIEKLLGDPISSPGNTITIRRAP